MLWLKIARAQKKSVPEAQAANPSSHVELWAEFFEWEWNERTPTLYYLAQNSRDVKRVLSKHPERIKTEDSMIEFATRGGKGGKSSPVDSKTCWLVGLGVAGNPEGIAYSVRTPPGQRQSARDAVSRPSRGTPQLARARNWRKR